MSVPRIEIDHGRCIACGLCARDCVSGVILMEDNSPAVKNPGWCNRCSHCVAICPEQAVSHDGLTGWPSRPLEPRLISPESYREIVIGRRSVRWYRPDPVPPETITEILDLANYSPTASNAQDVAYTVITDRERIQAAAAAVFARFESMIRLAAHPAGRVLIRVLAPLFGQARLARYLDRAGLYRQWTEQGRDLVAHSAPALILVHGPERTNFARDNCLIAATNLANYAHARGLGTCFIGFLVVALARAKALRELLGVPPKRKVHAVLTLGFPEHDYANTPVRPPARVTWLPGG